MLFYTEPHKRWCCSVVLPHRRPPLPCGQGTCCGHPLFVLLDWRRHRAGHQAGVCVRVLPDVWGHPEHLTISMEYSLTGLSRVPRSAWFGFVLFRLDKAGMLAQSGNPPSAGPSTSTARRCFPSRTCGVSSATRACGCLQIHKQRLPGGRTLASASTRASAKETSRSTQTTSSTTRTLSPRSSITSSQRAPQQSSWRSSGHAPRQSAPSR